MDGWKENWNKFCVCVYCVCAGGEWGNERERNENSRVSLSVNGGVNECEENEGIYRVGKW